MSRDGARPRAGRPGRRSLPARLPGLPRVVAVVVLMAVAVAGLRSRPYAMAAQAAPGGVERWTGTLLVAALIVTGMVLLGVFFFSPRRRRDKETERVPPPLPVSRWGWLVALLIVLAVVGGPIALLIARQRHGGGVAFLTRGVPGLGVAPGTPPTPPSGGPGTHGAPAMTVWPWVVLAVAAAVLLVLWFLRRPRTPGEPVDAPPPGEPLGGVVDAGLAALRGGDDPRAAVLACYAAMERALTATEAGPRRADTPAEVVTRAARTGLVDAEAAAALAGLFRRARYSAHPMDVTDRQRAETALERIRADLEVHA